MDAFNYPANRFCFDFSPFGRLCHGADWEDVEKTICTGTTAMGRLDVAG